jgi:MgtC family/Domain of unknown function (DUF4010)
VVFWLQPSTEGVRIATPVVAVQLAASLCIGMLVGIEREWANKELGLRIFAFVSVLGMLSAHLPNALASVAFVGVLLLIAASDVRNFLSARPLELTTSSAALLVFVAGYLVGSGHVFTPVASAIIITMLLAWKLELRKFAGELKLEEIRSAVVLGLLGFVVYPIIPDRFVDPWQLFNPRAAWVIVIVIAGIGFLNYVLLKLYSTRGVYLSAFLSGLVNSTAAAAALAKPLGTGGTPFGVAAGRPLAHHCGYVYAQSCNSGNFFSRCSCHGRRALAGHGHRSAGSDSSVAGTRQGHSPGNST